MVRVSQALFLFGMYQVTLAANLEIPVALPWPALFLVVGFFVVATIIWTVLLLFEFRKKK